MDKNLQNLFIGMIKADLEENQDYTYLTDMAVLITKSFIPSLRSVGVEVNYERYMNELNLWFQYRDSSNKVLSNMRKIEADIYWNEEDDSISYRIIPMIIVNENYNQDEIIKNILFTTGNIKNLFNGLVLSRMIHLILQDKINILEIIKDELIGFSQVDFIEKYSVYFRKDMEEYKGNYSVEFEKERVKLISILNKVPMGDYEEIQDMINLIEEKQPSSWIGRVVDAYAKGGFISTVEVSTSIANFGPYLVNLRKGKISPEALKIDEYVMPDIFKYKKGDEFYHTLLNKAKVLDKVVEDGSIRMAIGTKSGLYEFKS